MIYLFTDIGTINGRVWYKTIICKGKNYSTTLDRSMLSICLNFSTYYNDMQFFCVFEKTKGSC